MMNAAQTTPPITPVSKQLKPIVWSIAGSDSGSGAGIQADIKTLNALGVYGCTVITALTAQNTMGVSSIEYASPSMIAAQLQKLLTDFPPVCLKLGMMGNDDSMHLIAKVLKQINAVVVCDPVMVSSNGDCLMQKGSTELLKQFILPLVDLLTPNMDEAVCLLGRDIESDAEVEQAAEELLAFGVGSVLLKGGHRQNVSFSQDFYTDGKTKAWLNSPHQETRHHHGTGCTLSAAITAALALGHSVLDACVIGKAYVNQGLRLSPAIGAGHGPLAHLGWPEFYEDLPWLSSSACQGRQRLQFPDCGSQKLGFYPIVNRAFWLEKILPLGVSTIQLRIKDLKGHALRQEIAEACAVANHYQARLFINDYWELALEYNAYGVHLGQEDLEIADLQQLVESGIRLGVSTHCYAEVARAIAIQPSYIAIGPIYPTTTKIMKSPPQGLAAVQRWRNTLSYPLVAIGGIFFENALPLIDCGVDGIAVIRDIANTTELEKHVACWLDLFEGRLTQEKYKG